MHLESEFTGLFVILMQYCLSLAITISGLGLSVVVIILHSKRCTHLTSWMIRLSAMYSDSLIEIDTLDCFLLPQLAEAPTIVKTYPEVDQRST